MSIDSSSPDQALAERLERARPHLAAASLRYMSADPFWQERFGERAARFATEDANYHVTYLITAVWEGSSTALQEYARWLRSVLVSRGMCTRHLSAHFEEMRKVLGATAGTDAAAAYLEDAIEALTYDPGPAAALQAEARRLGADVTAPAGLPFHSAWDPEHLVHYVADALAAGHDRWLADHLRWSAGALAVRSGGLTLAATLDRLEAVLASAGPHGRAAIDVLGSARQQAEVHAR